MLVKCIRLIVLIGLIKTGWAQPLIFGTGTDNTGARVTSAGNDLHYTLGAGSAQVVTQNFTATFPIGPWADPNAAGVNANWVSVTTDATVDPGAGPFTFTTTFDLTGFSFTGITLSGNWGADNSASALLNGNLIGTVGSFSAPLSSFSTSNLAFFLPTINTLSFVVSNGGGPSGLIVSNPTITITAPEINPGCARPPLCFGLAFLGLMCERRRRPCLQ